MITKEEIDQLAPSEKLEILQLVWASLVAAPESFPVSDSEKQAVLERSRAHHLNVEPSLTESEFKKLLNQQLGRSK